MKREIVRDPGHKSNILFTKVGGIRRDRYPDTRRSADDATISIVAFKDTFLARFTFRGLHNILEFRVRRRCPRQGF